MFADLLPPTCVAIPPCLPQHHLQSQPSWRASAASRTSGGQTAGALWLILVHACLHSPRQYLLVCAAAVSTTCQPCTLFCLSRAPSIPRSPGPHDGVTDPTLWLYNNDVTSAHCDCVVSFLVHQPHDTMLICTQHCCCQLPGRPHQDTGIPVPCITCSRSA